jgi:uncharacterized protein (DUF486 family)
MIFTISLVETGLYLILAKVTLKTSDKYSLKVLVLSLGLQLFSILLIIESATLGPGVYSASNRNEYQELIK